MTVVLYRPSLDARSGAGQLLEMQWRGLRCRGRAGGDRVRARRAEVLAANRRARAPPVGSGDRAAAARRARSSSTTACALPSAELVFVHNLATEARRHLPHADCRAAAAQREREFFRALNPTATVVANSQLVAEALHEHFGIARERAGRSLSGLLRCGATRSQRAAELRGGARARSASSRERPLVGFVTSGDFAKRGLDLFLDCAARIARARPDARFLVVGSKELPERRARRMRSCASGVVLYRPKSRRPERWFAALDLFLYAARFEEFGMVLAEAQAMGVPVLTSRLVGASECLPGRLRELVARSPRAR